MQKAISAWLVLLLLLAYTAPWANGPSGQGGPRPPDVTTAPEGTYFVWEAEEPADVAYLCHAALGGRDLAVLVLNSSGLYRLLALDARTGSELASGMNFTCCPYRLCPAGDHLIALCRGEASYHLLVLNSSLNLVFSSRFDVPLEGPWVISPSSFLCLANRTLFAYSLEGMSVNWSLSFREADFLTVLPIGEAILVLRHSGPTWLAYRVSPEDGSLLSEAELDWLSWASGIAPLPYNASCLLAWAWNESLNQVSLVHLDVLKPSWTWSSSILSHVLVIPDLDGDRTPDIMVLSASGGRTDLRVISGSTGHELLSARKDLEVVSALWAGGRKAFLVAEDGVYLEELDLVRGELRDLWHLPCSHACLLADLDGDGFSELLASEGNLVMCVWGSYDNSPPLVSASWPPDGFSTSVPGVLLKARAEDHGSGVKRVVFVVDGREVDATYDGGYYVAYVRLSEGIHKWSVKAVDRVGLSASDGPRHITVNMSFFGGPGWEDDALFFGPWAAALIALAVLVLRKKFGRPGVSQSSALT